jgi:hypothetical protein
MILLSLTEDLKYFGLLVYDEYGTFSSTRINFLSQTPRPSPAPARASRDRSIKLLAIH